jgi:ABC-2 type transport system permease protein
MTAVTAEPAGMPEEPPLVAPGEQGGLHRVFQERYLLKLLVRKELRARYQGSVLGLLWSYVQPAVRFLAYYLVIGYIFGLHRAMTNFPVHIFSGMVMVHYFTETFGAGTRSIVKNRKIIEKLPLPREMFPVASMVVSAYHTLPQMVILLVAVTVLGWDGSPSDVAAGMLGFSIIAVLGMSLALIFSAANVFFRDFQNVVAVVGIFVTWSVPMVYPYERIQQNWGGTWAEQVYLANPLADAVLLFQQLFWVPTVPPGAEYPAVMPAHLFERGFIALGVSLVILVFAQMFFTRTESRFVERL